MDPGYLTGLAIFSGSVVGALTSLTSAWLTKQHEARVQRASENKVWRQRLYAQFIDEASKLYVDALVRDRAEAPAMVGVYALISKMRMASGAEIVESAEAVIRTILATYSRPNKSSPELQELILNRKFVDPLLTFSEVCRNELRDHPPYEKRPFPLQQLERGGIFRNVRRSFRTCGVFLLTLCRAFRNERFLPAHFNCTFQPPVDRFFRRVAGAALPPQVSLK